MSPTAQLTLPVAGVYSADLHAFPAGTQWDRDTMLRNETRFRENLTGPFTQQILSLIAEQDRAAAEVVTYGVRGATRRAFIQHGSYRFLIKDGQISDIRLYEDTFQSWDVWDNPGIPATHPFRIPAHAHSMVFEHREGTPFPADAPTQTLLRNKDVVRRFLQGVPTLARVPTANFDAVHETWAADGLWCMVIGGDRTGAQRASGESPCFDRESMLRMQQTGQRNLKEPLTLDINVDSMIAEGDQVSVEAVAFDIRDNDRAYRQHYSIHCTLRDGRLIEGHVYQDTLHLYDVKRQQPNAAPVSSVLDASNG